MDKDLRVRALLFAAIMCGVVMLVASALAPSAGGPFVVTGGAIMVVAGTFALAFSKFGGRDK